MPKFISAEENAKKKGMEAIRKEVSNRVKFVKGEDVLASMRGKDGLAGKDGINGRDGVDGKHGLDGAQGPKGVDGSGFTWKGDWKEREAYSPLDVVNYQGSTYVATVASKGDYPNRINNGWDLMAAAGAGGATGPQGPQGPAGSGGGGGLVDGDMGDIIVSGSGTVLTVDTKAVTFPKMQDIATSSILGRATTGTGSVEQLTPTQTRTILNVADGATANSSDATLLDRANHTGTQAQSTVTNLVSDLAAKQPLDGDLTAIAALTGTNTLYYRSAADTWSPVTIGANLAFSGGTLSAGAGGSVAWGAITGTLSSQTDLQTALDAKQPLDSDLTTIAGLTATTDNFLQAKAGAWASRTVAQVKTDLGLTGTNSGDQTITLTGDVTGSGTASFATTIANSVVTLAKMADMATGSLIYRKTAGTGVPEVNTLATLKTDLGLTGTNSGDQTITLTGNVTGTGTGSFATTIANNVVTNAMLAQVATATFKGRTTAGTGNVEDLTVAQAKTLLNLTGTNSGDQTITLTGDVSGTGTASFATTIGAGVVSNSKLANVSTGTFKGRTTAGTGSPEDLTGTQATALLDTFTSANKGLAPASGGGTTNFLRADGTWAAPAGGGGGGPAGSDTQIQYNNAGAFGGASKASIGSAGNLILGSNAAQPAVPPADTIQFYARRRAGADWPEFQRPNGREIPVQPHAGLNRVATWSPLSGSTVTAIGMPRTGVGTVSHPALASTNLSTSMRRWRMTSASTANSVADERSAATVCWRGNAASLGGWTYINRVSLNSIQAASVAYFGLSSSVVAFSTTQTIAALTNVVGFGFTNGTNTNWQIITNDASGAPTLTDLGASFPVSSLTNVYTFVIYAAPNGSSIWVQAKNEIDGTVVAVELTTDIPANTTFLSVRNFLHNGGAAAAVSYNTSGLYLETDY